MYSKDINPVCALCMYSQKVKGNEEHLRCSCKSEYVPVSGSCDRFKYDIFKKPVRRRRRNFSQYNPEDFIL